jgi:hypothetical protein
LIAWGLLFGGTVPTIVRIAQHSNSVTFLSILSSISDQSLLMIVLCVCSILFIPPLSFLFFYPILKLNESILTWRVLKVFKTSLASSSFDTSLNRRVAIL